MTGHDSPRIDSAAPASRSTWPTRELLPADLRHALFVRNLSKPVHDSRSIDDMEIDRGWEPSAAVELGYTEDRSRTGTQSLRLAFDQRNEEYLRAARKQNGSFTGEGVIFEIPPFAVAAHLRFETPQDWTAFNRIGLWCYAHPTGNPVSALALQFVSAGALTGPSDPIAINYFADLQEGEWNHLVWEIPELERDRVVDVSLFVPSWGLNLADSANRRILDLDDLRLEAVDAEQVAGWEIAPTKVAYSHIGYPVHGEKVAIVGGRVEDFRLIDDASGRVVATLPATRADSPRGAYSRLDFSSFIEAGRYRLDAGPARSEAFPIGGSPWRDLVRATLNGLYSLRCGFAVPGVQDACHCDHIVSHEGDLRVQGGGWHDAANLSQSPENTNMTVCALLDLAEALAPSDPELAERALEEARWGLEWVQRMRFGPGLRYLMGAYSYYTDGIPGTLDDIVDENVGYSRFHTISGALAQARGARLLQLHDPDLAASLLREAEEDFAVVRGDRAEPPVDRDEPDWTVAPWQNEVGHLALLAIELARATGTQAYAEDAARFGREILDLQERRFVDGSPVTGYFFEDAARTRILHEGQRTSGAPHSFEDGALLALQALCETFPTSSDWIDWYAGLVAYSEYFCRTGAAAAAPFDLVPAAVWRRSDLDGPMNRDLVAESLAQHANALFPTPPTPELVRQQMAELYEAGTVLSDGQRLRTFPLYNDRVRHGSTAVHLTKAIGLGAAAQARNLPALSSLLARQIHWLVGMNPFSRSLVYGVGYDWWQNFTVSLPNVVGGVAVGMNTYRGDAPAWGNNAVFPYKEVWVISIARLAGALARVPGRALVTGDAAVDATFRHRLTGECTAVTAGAVRLVLPPGEYDVEFGGARRTLTLADGTRRELHLDPGSFLELGLETVERTDGTEALRVVARGAGPHTVELRAHNVRLDATELPLDLDGADFVIELPLTVVDAKRMWTVVAVPDGVRDDAREAFGAGPGWPDAGSPVGGA